MNAGLPGTGLGGLFYIACAMIMPLHRAARGGGHRGRDWGRVGAQAGIALGIVAGLFVTVWAIGFALAPDPMVSASGASPAGPAGRVLRRLALFGTAGVLTLLLAAVEIAGIVLRRRNGGRRRRPTVHARHARIRAVRRRREGSSPASPAGSGRLPRVA